MFFHFDFWPPRTTVVDDFGPREAFLRQRRAFLAIYPEKQRDPERCLHMDTHEGANYRGCLCCGGNLKEIEAAKDANAQELKAARDASMQAKRDEFLRWRIAHHNVAELEEKR